MREKFPSKLPAVRKEAAAIIRKARVSPIDANDLAGIHRYVKCHVANAYWDKCSKLARQTLLVDSHHFVRSCAILAQVAS